VRGHQKNFDTSTTLDLPIAGGIALITVGLATAILRYLGFWGLFVAPIVGSGIAELIRLAVKRRRSRRLTITSLVGGVMGVLLYLVMRLVPIIIALSYGVEFIPGYVGATLLDLAWPLVNGVLIISSMSYRLGGIKR
jgi:hypothetical protein